MATLAGEQDLQPGGPNRTGRTLAAPVTGKFLVWALALVALPVLALLLWSDALKGVWYDELWSKWMASRELGLVDAAHDRWFQDVHPPLFYLINWSVSAFVGPEIVVHRWINLVWLAALGGVGVWLARVRPAMGACLAIGAVLVLSNRDLRLFVEYRSYALVFCATAAMMLLLNEILARSSGDDGRDLRSPRDRALAVISAGTIILALNIHYIATAICGVTIAVFAFDRAWRGKPRWAALLLGTAVLAMLPVLGSLWAQRPYMATTVPNFWVDTNLLEGARIIAGRIFYALGFNLVIVAVLVYILGTRRGRAAIGGSPVRFVVLTVISVVLGCGLLLIINSFKSVIMQRYLIALSPITITAIAALTANRLMQDRRLFIAFACNAAVVGIALVASTARMPTWSDGARIVANAARACPATLVYTVSRTAGMPVPRSSGLPNEAAFYRWAMADISRSFGIEARHIVPAGQHLALSPPPCDTILWIEHHSKIDGARTAAAAGLVAPDSTLRAQHTSTGTVLTLSRKR